MIYNNKSLKVRDLTNKDKLTNSIWDWQTASEFNLSCNEYKTYKTGNLKMHETFKQNCKSAIQYFLYDFGEFKIFFGLQGDPKKVLEKAIHKIYCKNDSTTHS